MKKPFEQYLAFIEHELGYKLCDWQKSVLREVYDGKNYRYYFGRLNGITMLYRAAEMLKEEMARDTECLPARLYELDGYMTDTVIYDELEKEN
jgi:hypothetical protein